MKGVSCIATALLLALPVSNLASAQSRPAGVRIEQAWARATPAGAKTGAAYVTIANPGGSDDRLLNATTPAAERVQFHKETQENGISRMREVRQVELPAGATIVLKPGDMHMMLTGLKRPLKQGEPFPLTLTFEHSGSMETEVSVQGVGAMHAPDHMHH